MEFLDPRAEPGAPVEPYTLSADLSGPVRLGLLANGFPDSEAFLDRLEKSLAERLPNAGFVRHNKGNASAVVSDDMRDDLLDTADAVVAAYGH